MAAKKKATKKVDVVEGSATRVVELEGAIRKALEVMDPKGVGAPQEGSPGYMIEVVQTLKKAL